MSGLLPNPFPAATMQHFNHSGILSQVLGQVKTIKLFARTKKNPTKIKLNLCVCKVQTRVVQSQLPVLRRRKRRREKKKEKEVYFFLG